MNIEECSYQQWVDMYNAKDKECFALQLKLSKIEKYIEYHIECKLETLLNASELQLTEKGLHLQRILKIIRGEE